MRFNNPEDIIALTPEWIGERFPDGRPKVPDSYLDALLAEHINPESPACGKIPVPGTKNSQMTESGADSMNDSMKQKALPIPDWFRKSAVYQINLRTFSPEGTIDAVRCELPFLKQNGFRVLYLCPIFREDSSEDRNFWSKRQLASKTGNPKNPYRIDDYFQIDEEYGDMEDLAQLVTEAHSLGMKVLLDLVYLHIGPNAPILKTHPEFAMHNLDGSILCTEWNFPHLNFENPGLREYLYCNMNYYIGVLDVDGFRCDASDYVPNDFWIEGRKRIQSIKPDAVLINEGGKVHRVTTSFDSCYHCGWHLNVYGMLQEEISFERFLQNEKQFLSQFPEGCLMLRDMDNHDTVTDWPERTELFLGHAGMDCVQILNYVLPGIPMVYCGNELADASRHSMFANRFCPGDFEVADRNELRKTEKAQTRLALMKTLNSLLWEHPAMHSGDIRWVDGLPDGMIAFYRQGGGKELMFVCNLSKETIHLEGTMPAGRALLEKGIYAAQTSVCIQPFGYNLIET